MGLPAPGQRPFGVVPRFTWQLSGRWKKLVTTQMGSHGAIAPNRAESPGDSSAQILPSSSRPEQSASWVKLGRLVFIIRREVDVGFSWSRLGLAGFQTPPSVRLGPSSASP